MSARFRTLVLVNIAGLIAVLIVNYLSNSLPLNGKTTGQLSDQYPNLFVPTGLAFSIWGMIYLLLIGWVLVQALGLFSQKQRAQTEASVMRVGGLFALSCVFNIAWLFAWHWEHIGLSIGIMVLMLTSLVVLNEKIQNGRAKVSGFEKGFAHTAFALYQGWITVALIANVTAFLVAVGWSGFGLSETIWAVLMIGVGAGLAIYMTMSRNMIFHGLAVCWALLGIYLKRNAAADAAAVEYAALTGIALILVAIVVRYNRWRAY